MRLSMGTRFPYESLKTGRHVHKTMTRLADRGDPMELCGQSRRTRDRLRPDL